MKISNIGGSESGEAEDLVGAVGREAVFAVFEELVDLQHVTQQSDQAEAVRQAVREYLRMIRLRELISVSGQIEFDDNWRELEAAELAEVEFPVPGTGS